MAGSAPEAGSGRPARYRRMPEEMVRVADQPIARTALEQVRAAWPCCQLAAVSIQDLASREKRFFADLIPEAVAAVAIGHHVVTTEEWTWVQTSSGHERCDADDHALEVCVDLEQRLGECGFQSTIVPYPGESGLQFRFVAEAAGLGQIGANAFLLHPCWGPWVHLRVVATTAPLERDSLKHESACTRCNRCVEACPAGAITGHGFEGLRCRAYREERGEYNPVGEGQVYHWCLTCAQVCPIGDQPGTAG